MHHGICGCKLYSVQMCTLGYNRAVESIKRTCSTKSMFKLTCSTCSLQCMTVQSCQRFGLCRPILFLNGLSCGPPLKTFFGFFYTFLPVLLLFNRVNFRLYPVGVVCIADTLGDRLPAYASQRGGASEPYIQHRDC